MRFEPMENRIVVKADPPPDKIGSIVVPGSAESPVKGYRGTVLAVGPGTRDGANFVPMQLEVGDRVLFHEAILVEDSGDAKTLILYQHQVVARLHEENEPQSSGILN